MADEFAIESTLVEKRRFKPDGTFDIPPDQLGGHWRARPDNYVVSVSLDPQPRWARILCVYGRGSELRLLPYIDDSVAPDRDWGDGLARMAPTRAE